MLKNKRALLFFSELKKFLGVENMKVTYVDSFGDVDDTCCLVYSMSYLYSKYSKGARRNADLSNRALKLSNKLVSYYNVEHVYVSIDNDMDDIFIIIPIDNDKYVGMVKRLLSDAVQCKAGCSEKSSKGGLGGNKRG